MKFYSKKELIFLGGIILCLGIITALVTFFVMLPKKASSTEPAAITILKQEKKLEPSDFIFPEEYYGIYPNSFIRYRETGETWDKEESRKYWFDPQKLGLEYLKNQNALFINDFIKNIP